MALRLLLWLPTLLWLGWRFGQDYASLFLPLYQAVLGVGLTGFHFADLRLIHDHEYLIEVQYHSDPLFFYGRQLLPDGVSGNTHAPIYYALTHPIILSAAALIWPRLTWSGRLLRLLVSLPILVLLEALDIPLVIYSSIHDAMMQTYDPGGYLAAKPIDWIKVLEGGGRLALCIASSYAAAGLHGVYSRWRGVR